MEQRVDIVFFGTDKTGDDRAKVVSDVRRLLKLGEEQAERLFGHPQGVVLMSTPDRGKASQLVDALVRLGAKCTLREPMAPDNPWQQWELEETETKEVEQRFKCLACGHQMIIPPGQEMPDVCPECDVVQSKYESVAAQKHEREKIKRSMLHAREAQQKRDEADAERRRQEALRKEIEKELRRELEAQGAKKRLLPMFGTGAATFVLGIGVAIGYLALTGAGGEVGTQAGGQTAATAHALTGQAAVTIANDLIGRMGGAMPTSGKADTVTAKLSASGAPQVVATTLPGQLPSMDLAAAVAVADEASLESTPEFFSALADDPLLDARMQHELKQQVALGKIDTAGEIRALATSPAQQVGMQSQIALSDPGQHSTPVLMHEMQRLIAKAPHLEDKAFGTLALEAVTNAGSDQAHEEDFPALFDPNSEGTLDRLKAEALIASARAKQGKIVAAQRWFDSANDTLLAMRDPIDQLKALPALAIRYFEANDRDTAQSLLGWTRQGLIGMPPSGVRDALAESVAAAYATVGQSDQAAATIRFFFESQADRDLRLSRLARDTAFNGQVLPAEGLTLLIASDAQRAVARAQISLIAKYEGQDDVARSLVEQARRDSADLRSPAREVVASELLRATETIGNAKTSQRPSVEVANLSAGDNEAIDQAKAVIAKNLAWVGDHEAAAKMAAEISDQDQRLVARQVIADIEALATIAKSPTASGQPAYRM